MRDLEMRKHYLAYGVPLRKYGKRNGKPITISTKKVLSQDDENGRFCHCPNRTKYKNANAGVKKNRTGPAARNKGRASDGHSTDPSAAAQQAGTESSTHTPSGVSSQFPQRLQVLNCSMRLIASGHPTLSTATPEPSCSKSNCMTTLSFLYRSYCEDIWRSGATDLQSALTWYPLTNLLAKERIHPAGHFQFGAEEDALPVHHHARNSLPGLNHAKFCPV